MYFYPPFWRYPQGNSIIDFKQGDVNGDRIKDNIYLVGEKATETETPYYKNIRLVIQDGKTNKPYRIVPQENQGYNPTIFLGDFTGDRVDDILINIDSGGSGGYAFYFMYSFLNNIPKELFNSESFYEKYKYDVIYRDNYQVEVKGPIRNYTVDIKYKGEEYLSEIYDDNGKLKEPIEGWVNPLGGLYPVDFQRDGIYELYASQWIAGRYNADGIGYMQTSLEWDGTEFVPLFQTLGILG